MEVEINIVNYGLYKKFFLKLWNKDFFLKERELGM